MQINGRRIARNYCYDEFWGKNDLFYCCEILVAINIEVFIERKVAFEVNILANHYLSDT